MLQLLRLHLLRLLLRAQSTPFTTLYEAGSEDKGENLAGEAGLADGENVVITRDVEADKQGDMTYVLEFTTEDGSTQSFETLHYETTPISLKSVDAAAGATPIAFAAPEQ